MAGCLGIRRGGEGGIPEGLGCMELAGEAQRGPIPRSGGIGGKRELSRLSRVGVVDLQRLCE